MPAPFAEDRRESIRLEQTSLHHFALEIDKGDFEGERERLRNLGVDVTTAYHGWYHCHTIYVTDPDGTILELVCFDESIAPAPLTGSGSASAGAGARRGARS